MKFIVFVVGCVPSENSILEISYLAVSQLRSPTSLAQGRESVQTIVRVMETLQILNTALSSYWKSLLYEFCQSLHCATVG